MRERLPLLIAVFVVMALSNAIVPVLPTFAENSTVMQASIFAAYFFGALVTVLPAGVLSDRYGRILFIKAGIALTALSGVLMIFFPQSYTVLGARLLEGIGAGLYISAAMSWVNSQEDHEYLSGNFMAALNLGLVIGLFGGGWLANLMGMMRGGILLFTVFSGIAFLLSFLIREGRMAPGGVKHLFDVGLRYHWLYFSALILLGATGVVSALYPAFTGGSPTALSLEIGLMYASTFITVLVASHAHLDPVRAIQASAFLMAIGVLFCYFTPVGFVLVGALAGVVIIAQMAFLADTGMPQGAVIGLFNISTYSGMSLLPFIAGVVVQFSGNSFLIAFAFTAILCVIVGGVIGKVARRSQRTVTISF
ncbi:MAG: MFS transporter [Methanomicrobiales archaeon]|nr:MFS transporter [Methanomicrobiales archaeon]